MKELLIAIGIIIAAAPAILLVLSLLTWFYTRTFYPQLITRVFTWNWQKEEINIFGGIYEDKEIRALFIWLMILVGYSAIAVGSYQLNVKYGFIGIIVPITTILVLIAPRYIVDLCKVLKYNRKTQESDRFSDLERKIERLEKKERS